MAVVLDWKFGDLGTGGSGKLVRVAVEIASGTAEELITLQHQFCNRYRNNLKWVPTYVREANVARDIVWNKFTSNGTSRKEASLTA